MFRNIRNIRNLCAPHLCVVKVVFSKSDNLKRMQVRCLFSSWQWLAIGLFLFW
jgi:hypothetical protein